MKFCKEHPAVRMILIGLFFVIGVALSLVGWRMTGELKGLILMIIGVFSFVLALWVYNIPFGNEHDRR